MTNSIISLPTVLRDFSPLSLVILQLLLATTVDVCGWGWEEVILGKFAMLVNCSQPVFGSGQNNTHPATIVLVSVATSLRS